MRTLSQNSTTSTTSYGYGSCTNLTSDLDFTDSSAFVDTEPRGDDDAESSTQSITSSTVFTDQWSGTSHSIALASDSSANRLTHQPADNAQYYSSLTTTDAWTKHATPVCPQPAVTVPTTSDDARPSIDPTASAFYPYGTRPTCTPAQPSPTHSTVQCNDTYDRQTTPAAYTASPCDLGVATPLNGTYRSAAVPMNYPTITTAGERPHWMTCADQFPCEGLTTSSSFPGSRMTPQPQSAIPPPPCHAPLDCAVSTTPVQSRQALQRNVSAEQLVRALPGKSELASGTSHPLHSSVTEAPRQRGIQPTHLRPRRGRRSPAGVTTESAQRDQLRRNEKTVAELRRENSALRQEEKALREKLERVRQKALLRTVAGHCIPGNTAAALCLPSYQSYQ